MAGILTAHPMEELARVVVGVLLVLRVRLERLALRHQCLKQIVELVVDAQIPYFNRFATCLRPQGRRCVVNDISMLLS